MDKSDINLSGQPNILEDYTHSSNSLFHFMNKQEYLFNAINRRALIPRYCKENIEYLGLSLNGISFKEMAVLMKCFCDIPLHKITQDSECSTLSIGESKSNSTQCRHNHTSLYGEYALAFSKSWGEQRGIQPITYLNANSQYLTELCKTINYAISGEEQIPDIVADNYLLQLAFFKPLRGLMFRNDNGEKITIEKNFYDEQEWRFVPSAPFIDDESILNPIIANPNILNDKSDFSNSPMNLLSDKLFNIKYEEYWLKFEYNDIRYIIVPNKQSRLDFISDILEADNTPEMEKHILISKVLILDEIRKDW